MGHVSAALQTGLIRDGTRSLKVKFAFANVAAGSTDASLVSAVSGRILRVLAYVANCGATATTIVFNTKPSGAGTAIWFTAQNGANGGEVIPFSPVGWFETVRGEGLTVTTGAGSTTGVGVVYIEVPE